MILAWPQHMKSDRAAGLGLNADASLQRIVEEYAGELQDPAGRAA
jgi:hypothetical protein